MQDYTQEELEIRYKKLPKPLKEALFDPDIAYAIFDTGKKYGMTIDQIGSIADEVGYVIAGLTRPSEFVENLRGRLGAPHDTVRDIALEINHAVFASIREILKSTHQIDVSDEEFARPYVAPAQKQKEALPKKVFAELKDLEEDEIEADIDEEREFAAIKNEEEEELSQPEPAFPVPAPVPRASPSPILPKPPVIFEQPKKMERQAPSWIREQEERKALREPHNGREFTAKETLPRFTLDLRNKTPITPLFPVPQKSPLLKLSASPMEKESVAKQQPEPMTTQQKSAPPELESVIKDEDEIMKPPIIKSPEQKPQPSPIPEKHQQTPKPSSDPYRESIG